MRWPLSHSLRMDAPLPPEPLGLADIASGHPDLIEALRTVDPLLSAAWVGALLTVPELQSNAYRLEVLTHLAFATGATEQAPTPELLSRAFVLLGEGFCGRQEDPAEDLFVFSISTPRGNFRLLAGLLESSGFYIQRVMNVVEGMPRREPFNALRDSLYALLRLSDLVCERAGLSRNRLGHPIPEQALEWGQLPDPGALLQRVQFSAAELTAAGVSMDALTPFLMTAEQRSSALTEAVCDTTLERYPLSRRGNAIYFVLPTATSAALRRYLLEWLDEAELLPVFVGALAREYSQLFSRMRLLGDRIGAPIEFRATREGLLAGVGLKADVGRYVGLLFVMDTLEDADHRKLPALEPAADLTAQVERLEAEFAARPDFREGLLLIVRCGIGRGTVTEFHRRPDAPWLHEMVSASDLVTLSEAPQFEPLELWRILATQRQLDTLGVELFNINGLLNLVAWVRSLHGHLVPHGALPDEFGTDDAANLLMIDQNALLSLRHEVAVRMDAHVEQDIEGRWVGVRKLQDSLFEEDRRRPLYAESAPSAGHKPRACCVTPPRAWWCETIVPETTDGRAAYDRFMTTAIWLGRMAPVLDPALTLPPGALLWKAEFRGVPGTLRHDVEPLNAETARAELSVRVDPERRIVTTIATARFEQAILHVDNIAESALVDVVIEGVARLAGRATSAAERAAWLQVIVPDTLARHTHAFRSYAFRDAVRQSLPDEPVTITPGDGAALALGLGWQIRPRSAGADIRGESACKNYLNRLVQHLEAQLCAELRALDRRQTLELALLNHEAAAAERSNWTRTTAALLSLHEDRAATLEALMLHEQSLTATFQGSRLLIEFALCECPLTGGREPGTLELARLMGLVRMIFDFGGWSDAIHWQAMEPHLHISPLGEVQHRQGFLEEVIKPFARSTSDQRAQRDADRYPEHLKEKEPVASAHSAFEPAFLQALEEECGATLDGIRAFVDALENLGLHAGRAVLRLRRSQLPPAPPELLEFFTFKPRAAWHDLPPGYREVDRDPWRFRRRLSVLRKPLVQIDHTDDPELLVVPGLVRDAFVYILGNLHRGDYRPWQLGPKMRSWAGVANDARGHAFNTQVAERLRELGWQAWSDLKVTKLLGQGFERDYGDVDVLAWHPMRARLLVMECKDLQFRKNYGEIAEQLSDFRGEQRADGRRDDLLRHLDRVDLLAQHRPRIARFLGVESVAEVESHLVFRHSVPMQYALQRLVTRVRVSTFDQLDKI